MELLEINYEIEHGRSYLTDANYIYLNLDGRLNKLPKNDYGIILSKVKLKNDDVYEVVINSNSKDIIVKSYIDEGEKLDSHSIKEYFINENNKFLKFSSEAYCMVISLKDKTKTKYVFSDYRDAIGYLESIDLS